jgi:hypothetical protein
MRHQGNSVVLFYIPRVSVCTVIFVMKDYVPPCAVWELTQHFQSEAANAHWTIYFSSWSLWQYVWATFCLVNPHNTLSQDKGFGLQCGQPREAGKSNKLQPIYLFQNTSLRNCCTLVSKCVWLVSLKPNLTNQP